MFQVVVEKNRKWYRIKGKAYNYLTAISIPGVSGVINTNNFVLKMGWILLILLAFAAGFWNIALAVTDYYNYDKITNIERVSPSNVTFPAITICNYLRYRKDLYVNGNFVNSTSLTISNDTNPTIKNFIWWSNTNFYLSELETFLDVRDHIEYFKIPDQLDCLRVNGVTNKSIELFTANQTEDYLEITMSNSYNESISSNRYFNNRNVNKFRIFVADNSLNSFDKLEPYILERNNRYDFDIAKETVEIKLPEPYNQCKESLSIKQYHQSNCFDTCLYREIREKYNCSFLLSLYSFDGFKQCDNLMTFYKKEFNGVCYKECLLESCYSEKYTSLLRISERSGYTYFRFSFRDFSTLNIVQIPKTDPFTFINNIGGGLGLFMGIAIPNIIEFLQFITEIFLITFVH